MFTRKLDSLRRVAMPKQIWQKLRLKKYQQVEVTIEYGYIYIKRFEPTDIYKRPYVGIVRELDDFYRVVIPSEYLKVLNLKPNTDILLVLEGERAKIYPKSESFK